MFHKKRFILLSLLLILVASMLSACQPLQSPASPQQATEVAESPSRILFIGDSFSMFLKDLFPKLATSTDPPTEVEIGLVWIGGAPLSLHWRRPTTLEKIQTGDWDVVVLQEDVAENWHLVDQFPEYAHKFDEEIQQSGAQTILYMHWPWASQAVPSTEQIAETYGELGTELGAKVAPVGLAWQRALEERPDLDLYIYDQIHANPLGVYLSMCVLYATIFDRSPVEATYRMADVGRYVYGWNNPKDWQLSDEDAEFLQRIAWETVTEYSEATANGQAAVTASQPEANVAPSVDDPSAVITAMIERFNASDLEGVLDYFADDAMVYFFGLPPTGSEVYNGREQFRPVWEENIASHLRWEVEIDSVVGETVKGRAKTWHDFTRELGVAPLEANEVWAVRDGKIAFYAWAATEESAGRLKAALAEAMPAEPTEEPIEESPVSAITVTFVDGTCSVDDPLTLQAGPVQVTVDVLDEDKALYAMTFFTLDPEKDLLDLMASTAAAGPPDWAEMISLREIDPGTSKAYDMTVQDGPVYGVCWSQPPESAVGNVGPFAVVQ